MLSLSVFDGAIERDWRASVFSAGSNQIRYLRAQGANFAPVSALHQADTRDDQRLLFALQAAKMYIWERDMASNAVERFGEPCDVLGFSVDSIEDFLAHVHHEDRTKVRHAIEGAILRCEPYETEFRILRPDGLEVWVRDIGRRIATDAGHRFLGVCIDVTAEIEARHTAIRLALHDGLTGLPNRTLLHERLNVAVATLRAGGPSFATLCVDLDGFKGVNDNFGHAAGDQLLVHVAKLLKSACRASDTVARVGGDEFVILLSPGTAETVQEVARAIFARAQAGFTLDSADVHVGFSIGAAIGPGDGLDAAILLHRADIALYRAKSWSRGELCFFEAGMDALAKRRRGLEQDLRTALARGELSLEYQPLVDLQTGRTDGVEALLRWSHPVYGAIAPEEFIPLAESSGLIVPIGEWVTRAACVAAADWPGVRMSVNISAVQFRHPGFVAAVAGALASTGLPPERLELEVTESVLINDAQQAIATFGQLKGLGVSIAMDDFGTGYSSLSYLSRFTFDKIKIDRSFTGNLGKTAEADAIVKAIINLGRSLAIKINAEGVETEAQLLFLSGEGCPEAQGYLFSRPVSADEISARLDHERGSDDN